MKKMILTLLSCLFLLQAWAAHPDIKYTEISGTKYSCHPVDKPQYCPRRDFDVPMGVMISLGRINCLDSIDKTDPEFKSQIRECFLNPLLKKFYEDLQLYDVKASCLKENLKSCKEWDDRCSEPPCGDLGGFIKEVKKRGLLGFDRSDGEEACNSLIQ